MKWLESTAPTGLPVTVSAATDHNRIPSENGETAYIQSLIEAATDYAQETMACSLMARTITATFYQGEKIHLPRGPLISITSVTDDDGVVITDYDIERVGHTDRLKINSSYKSPLVVVYQAGYASAAAIPATIRHAILAHVGTLYRNRESVSDRTLINVPDQLAAFYRMKSRSLGIG